MFSNMTVWNWRELEDDMTQKAEYQTTTLSAQPANKPAVDDDLELIRRMRDQLTVLTPRRRRRILSYLWNLFFRSDPDEFSE